MSAIYDVSILAVFKNEESFLPEWLDHYFNRNIDHIYLLNDNSNDNSVDIIYQHYNKKNITLLNVEKNDEYINSFNRQVLLYNKYFKYIIEETKWIGIFDLDEFCYSPSMIDLKYILNHYNKVSLIQELIIDWFWFGSNGYENQPSNIINSFTRRGEDLSKNISKKMNLKDMGYHYNWCCKSFAKTRFIKKLAHHFNVFNSLGQEISSNGLLVNFNLNISNNKLMFINHYLGSKNYYFNNKVARGSCNNSTTIINNKKEIYNFINLNNIEDIRLKKQNSSANIF